MDDLLRLTEALDDAARAREITALPSGWVRVGTGLPSLDGGSLPVEVFVRYLSDGRAQVSDLGAGERWAKEVCGRPFTPPWIDVGNVAIWLDLREDDPATRGRGVTVPQHEVAAAVARVTAYLVALCGYWHGTADARDREVHSA